MLPSKVLAAPAGSGLVRCTRDGDLVTISISMAAPTVSCPGCGCAAGRAHSRYTRRLTDLPCFGVPVRLELTVRRFRCSGPECPRRIFAERLPGFAGRYARTTDRLRRSHEAVGYALGGEAGARLAALVAMPSSPNTLLRRVRRSQVPSAPPPRAVGIDDWAWRKGRRYGTIVVDLERGRAIDLLPDREETVKRWLAEHPGVELISRDRASSYAKAAAEAAPRARQVADRRHLLENLREAVERFLEREHASVVAVFAAPTQADPGASTGTDATAPPPGSARPGPRPTSRRRCTSGRPTTRGADAASSGSSSSASCGEAAIPSAGSQRKCGCRRRRSAAT